MTYGEQRESSSSSSTFLQQEHTRAASTHRQGGKQPVCVQSSTSHKCRQLTNGAAADPAPAPVCVPCSKRMLRDAYTKNLATISLTLPRTQLQQSGE